MHWYAPEPEAHRPFGTCLAIVQQQYSQGTPVTSPQQWLRAPRILPRVQTAAVLPVSMLLSDG